MRRKRVKVEGGGYYHLMSRCALKQFLLGEDDKRAFVSMLHRIAAFSGIEVLTYCVMSNHFHVLVHVPRSEAPDEEELLTRVAFLYGHERSNDMRQRWHGYRNAKLDAALIKEQSQLRKRMGDISPFMQILKQRFTIWYRAHHEGHEGTLWQGRFSSTLVEGGGSLAAVAAYIDLNPVRAGLVADPKDYRFSGFGAATSGDKQASQGLTGIYGNTTNDTAKVMAAYRGLLYAKGGGAPPPSDKRKGPSNRRTMPLPMLLRCRIRAMTSGLAIGSQAFTDSIFSTHRYAFSEQRRNAARGMRLCPAWDGIQLCSVRHLRKNPITHSP